MAHVAPTKPQDRNRAILRSTLEPEARLVALAIADHMDAAGEAWPCADTLATETGYSERTVRDVLTHGIETGWLAFRWRPGRMRVLRIVWDRLADVDRPTRNAGTRRVRRGDAVSEDSDPERGAGSNRNGAPEREQPDPAPAAGTNRNGAPVEPERGAGSNRNGAPTKQTSEATMKRTSEATTLLSATADPVPSPPEKRKPARKAKTGKEPHPFADRVYKAWDRVWEKRMGEGNAYPWNYPVERAILTKCVADPYVSRDPDKGTEHMQLVGAAMTRYLSQEVDGRFVKGLSIKGFAGDVAKWLTPADTAVQIRRGPPEYRSISEILGEAEQPPTANRDAIDVAYRVVP